MTKSAATSALLLRAALVALAMSATLLWMVYEHARLLREGTEIVLKSMPIDPRDLLRGHYVRLGYEISRIPAEKFTDLAQGRRLTANTPVYVLLKKGEDGYWHLVSASLTPPVKDLAPGTVMLRGTLDTTWWLGANSPVFVTYGLERYYAEKSRALRLEREIRNRRQPLGVIVRVSRDGRGAIAGLMMNGKKIYEEPLW